MNFSDNELKVIKYALEWMNDPDTYSHDFEAYPEIWKTSFGSLDLKIVLETHRQLLNKLK